MLGTLPGPYQPASAAYCMVNMNCNLGAFVPLNAGGFANTLELTISSAFIGMQFAKPSGTVSILNIRGSGVVSLD